MARSILGNFGYVNILHEDRHKFIELYLRILVLGITTVRSFGVNLNTYFMLNLFFPKLCHLKKYLKEMRHIQTGTK